ncbi:MAG: prephenate dehydrogenase/arogenate dehydrogenase family protein [archaeon]|jgi:prephenate dehydrogenase
MDVAIIGGMGDFGLFYAKLFMKHGFNVFLNDLDETTCKTFCKSSKCSFIDIKDISKMDIVIVSVPNSVAPKLIQNIGGLLGENTLLIDFCSVKSVIFSELEKLKTKNIEIVSVHPMHGPRVSSIENYPVIYIPIKKGKKFEVIKDFFEKEKVNLIVSTVEEHDKILSLVQGLTHYSSFISAKTIKDMGINLKKAKDFSSPTFELFLSNISRIILQNPELYSQIQTENPYNKEMRELFSKNTLVLEEKSNKGSVELEKEVISSAQIFNSLDTVLLKSDIAVSSLKFIQNTLRENIGNKFLVENIYDNKFHYGVIKNVDSHNVIITERKKETTLRLSKIRLTTKKEMKDWKTNHILEKHIDYSFFVSINYKKENIFKAFSKITHSKFEIIDEFKSDKFPDGKMSITLRVHFFEDDDKHKIDQELIELLDNLGIERR